MDDKLDAKLCAKYPKIFRDRHGSMQTTCMCWGLAVGDGWYNILDNACHLIQSHINHQRSQRARILRKQRKGETLHEWEIIELDKGVTTQLVATQIKEKFGTLRFYYQGGDDYCDGVISMAESMTSTTCEQCGNVGKMNGGGWLSVMCTPCREKTGSTYMGDEDGDEDDDVEEDESTHVEP